MVERLVLVIEDEPGIVDFLERGLEADGYQVHSALDGEAGIAKAIGEPVDLVILDMMLPKRSGLEVLGELTRSKPTLPVIVLTARDGIDDRVTGLDSGAVDYLTKPFSLRELKARIRAQMRVATQSPSTILRAGDIELDLLRRSTRRSQEPVRLSSTEFELLAHLMRNRGVTLSRQEILRAVWGYNHDPGTNLVDVYIGYLRRKLALGDGDPSIVTVRSVGYRFDAPA